MGIDDLNIMNLIQQETTNTYDYLPLLFLILAMLTLVILVCINYPKE